MNDPVSLLQVGSSLGFAGLVWYLLAVRDPKAAEVRTKERKEVAEAQAKEREIIMQRFATMDAQHREERKEWAATMDRISERSSEAAKAGHTVALQLSKDLEGLKGVCPGHDMRKGE